MRISILDGATRMKRTTITAVVGLVAPAAPAAAPAIAQQVTGALGSLSATTTISGKQLPPLGGVMNLGANSRWSRRTPQSQKSFRWRHA
jgi:hypothetical protein